ncbi:oxysterol-binding protein-related protein 2 [Platysternon megacephalum]|uniref:Oxysterol-binding protein-related protein 2 n=1 Tax=Platysternon megacephalum TaxID=55544 RepID=A0A4D9E6G4_9SAUR|nr:oxysterol-binding protein-related protein 2 [Platysternon megacephalum]
MVSRSGAGEPCNCEPPRALHAGAAALGRKELSEEAAWLWEFFAEREAGHDQALVGTCPLTTVVPQLDLIVQPLNSRMKPALWHLELEELWLSLSICVLAEVWLEVDG